MNPESATATLEAMAKRWEADLPSLVTHCFAYESLSNAISDLRELIEHLKDTPT